MPRNHSLSRHAMAGLFVLSTFTTTLWADEPSRVVPLWSELAPGETTRQTGETLPARPNEDPPATRIGGITQPLLEFYEPPADKQSGAAVLVMPGGGFRYVVHDKEGVEPARWLNQLGITGIVLRYRTIDASNGPHWRRPVQDAQRAMRLLRANAAAWKIDPKQVGLLGFSAGGQAAALASTRFKTPEYTARDAIDEQSCRPDFAMLLYAGGLWDAKQEKLIDDLHVSADTPPIFMSVAHNDGTIPLGNAAFYTKLKQQNVATELHIFHNGGHGYGLRSVKDSVVHTWTHRAADWLKQTTTTTASR